MDLQFVAPDLRKLDETPTEILISTLFQDERPPRGTTSLVSWRLAGRVDRLVESGFLTGALGEVVLIPGRPRLAADKVLLFGLGPGERFDWPVFESVTDHILRVLAGLCARTAVIELPGRHEQRLPPEQTTDRFLAAAATWGGLFDGFVLVEPSDDQQRIATHRDEGRRRRRKR